MWAGDEFLTAKIDGMVEAAIRAAVGDTVIIAGTVEITTVYGESITSEVSNLGTSLVEFVGFLRLTNARSGFTTNSVGRRILVEMI